MMNRFLASLSVMALLLLSACATHKEVATAQIAPTNPPSTTAQPAQTNPPPAIVPAVAAVPIASIDPADQKLLQSWGAIVALEKNISGIDISRPELTNFLKGFLANLKNQPPPADLQKLSPDVERLAKDRRASLVWAATQRNERLAQMFFSTLQRNTNVLDLPGGLRYELLLPGTGTYPKPQQTVIVHYTGRLVSGQEFEQMEDYTIVLVTNHMSQCLFAGIQKTPLKGAIRLYVPPPLPEGDELRLGIPPGSAIVYDIEVLDIKDTSPDDLAIASLPPAPEPAPPPPSGAPAAQVMETWGWIVARESRLAGYGLSENEAAALVAGLASAITDPPSRDALRAVYPDVQKFAAAHRERVLLALKQKRLAEMDAFFAKLDKNTNVIKLPDGLRYEIVQPGTGPYPAKKQIVIADYTGRLLDGKVFDRTDNEPLHMQIGSLMPGLNEGLQKINKGGELKLYVPPDLGYGDEDASSVISSVPADSVLIYDIHLLDIQDAPKEDVPPDVMEKINQMAPH